MGKSPNKHLRARMSYLFDAASYLRKMNESVRKGPRDQASSDKVLSNVSGNEESTHVRNERSDNGKDGTSASLPATSPSSFTSKVSADQCLVSQIRSVSNKANVRIELKLKHQMCRRCNSVLAPGITSTESKENRSKGGKKPWATIKVIHCTVCGTSRRFPTGAKRQLRKILRPKSKE